MYRPLQVDSTSSQSALVTTMAREGMNQRDLSQFLDVEFAQIIRNYIPVGTGQLEKREGQTEIFEVAGNEQILMAEKYTDTLWLFAYNTTLAAYDVDTDTVTNIKTDFTASGTFEGARAGDYFFITNGAELPYRISVTLDYDAQTANFTVGETLTGGTSGATAIILEDDDSGVAGTLTLGSIEGVFQNNEALTDGATGAAVADGTLTWAATEVSNAPVAKGVRLLGSRLFLYALADNPSAVAYSDSDDGTNPPFQTWAAGTLADDPGLISNRNIGEIRDIQQISQYYVVWGDDGKFAFTISQLDSGGILSKVDDFLMHRVDFGGARGALMTPIGLVYANENGFYSLLGVGQDTDSFSDQDFFLVDQLGDDYFTDIDVTNGDIVFDEKRKNVLFTCARDSATNNVVIGYNVESKAVFEFVGWNVNRWFKIDGEIYAASSLNTSIHKCFDGHDDNGLPIGTEYVQELNMGSLYLSQDLLGCYVQGFLSASTAIDVNFDAYNQEGLFASERAQFTWEAQSVGGLASGFGASSWGITAWGGYSPDPNLVESFDGCRPFVRRVQRIVLRITSGDLVDHVINWIGIEVKQKNRIRRRKMTRTITT
ncbi:hypothetical protein HN682_08135 [Candidatus Peregrinibacteria bacterium]|nr:hypothetical protein [Candidatus Peregrinibacteria bacterium]